MHWEEKTFITVFGVLESIGAGFCFEYVQGEKVKGTGPSSASGIEKARRRITLGQDRADNTSVLPSEPSQCRTAIEPVLATRGKGNLVRNFSGKEPRESRDSPWPATITIFSIEGGVCGPAESETLVVLVGIVTDNGPGALGLSGLSGTRTGAISTPRDSVPGITVKIGISEVPAAFIGRKALLATTERVPSMDVSPTADFRTLAIFETAFFDNFRGTKVLGCQPKFTLGDTLTVTLALVLADTVRGRDNFLAVFLKEFTSSSPLREGSSDKIRAFSNESRTLQSETKFNDRAR